MRAERDEESCQELDEEGATICQVGLRRTQTLERDDEGASLAR